MLLSNSNFCWLVVLVNFSIFSADVLSPQEQLQKAILENSALKIEAAVKQGAILNDDPSPLLKAVLIKKFEAAKALLKFGANPNILYAGSKLVHYLIKMGDLELAMEFINAKADFSGILADGQDAFTYVSDRFDKPQPGKVTRSDFDLMYAMVVHGYNLKGNFEATDLSNNAWYLAIKNGDVNKIGFFLNWGTSMREGYPYKLPITADINRVFMYNDGTIWLPTLVAVKYFDEHLIKENRVGGGSALMTLIKYGNPDLNKKSKPLRDKPEQNVISFFLLLYELINDRPEILFEELQKHQADLVEGFKIYLESGGNSNHILSAGSKMDQKFSVSLLWLAIHLKDFKAVKFLIDNSVDINLKITPYPLPPQRDYNQLKDPSGYLRGAHTPLYFAMQQENTQIADLLLKQGALID